MLVAPLRASTTFYRRFTLPRRSSTGFGSYPSDLRHFHTSALITCGYSLSLRLPLYGLVSPLKYTPWPVIQNERCTLLRIPLYLVGFEVFSLSVKSSFQRSLTVLYTIGFKTYLRLEAVVPQFHTPLPRSATQETLTAVQSSSTGLSPSTAGHSRPLPVDWRGIKEGPATPHLLTFSSRIQFAVSRFHSPLLAASQLVSFPAGTKTFQFPAFASLTASRGSPIRKSRVQRSLAPRPGLSQLVTSFFAVSNQAVHLQG